MTSSAMTSLPQYNGPDVAAPPGMSCMDFNMFLIRSCLVTDPLFVKRKRATAFRDKQASALGKKKLTDFDKIYRYREWCRKNFKKRKEMKEKIGTMKKILASKKAPKYLNAILSEVAKLRKEGVEKTIDLKQFTFDGLDTQAVFEYLENEKGLDYQYFFFGDDKTIYTRLDFKMMAYDPDISQVKLFVKGPFAANYKKSASATVGERRDFDWWLQYQSGVASTDASSSDGEMPDW